MRVCNRYKKEQERSNDPLHMWKEETAKRLDAEKERDYIEKRHKHLIDEIFSMLKEVKCSSVRGVVDKLKAERLRGKVLEEDNESIRRECERLKQSYDKVREGLKVIGKNTDNLSDNYDRLIEDYNRLNTRCNNQKENIAKYIGENKRLTDKAEKLRGKLDRASKRYGELIKIISDKSIKAI